MNDDEFLQSRSNLIKCDYQFLWITINSSADGCYNYSTLDDTDRKSDRQSPGTTLCDKLLLEGWYRFGGAAGSKMPTMPVPQYRCGADWSGWLAGTEPTVADGEVYRKVCFTKRDNTCKYSKRITMKNCGSYFIYKLGPLRFVILGTVAQTKHELDK